eukprot:UN04521
MNGKAFLGRTGNKNVSLNKDAGDSDSGRELEWVFNESPDLIQFVESLGFQFAKQIFENGLEGPCLFVFRK